MVSGKKRFQLGDETVLAVIDGRFLPVENFSIDEEREFAVSGMRSDASSNRYRRPVYNVSFETRRPPNVRSNGSHNLDTHLSLVLYTANNVILFSDCFVSETTESDTVFKFLVTSTAMTLKER